MIKMSWKSFAIGFVAGFAFLSGISHWLARPQNVIAAWPDDNNKKGMQIIAPWITAARVGKVGPFVVMVPKSFNDSPEAILQPVKGKNPWIYVTGRDVIVFDSKKRSLSIDYGASTGEFRSYTYTPDLTAGLSFVDRGMTGVLEKIEPRKKKGHE